MELQNHFCPDLVFLEHDKSTISRLAVYTSSLRMPMNITAMKLLQFADAILSFETWCQKCLKESPLFHFWHLVLSMESTILSLVRAFREANFTLYCQALCALIPFFFANNNVNYARWLPVHLKDMLSLERKHPDVFQEFQFGKFVVFKASCTFSAMAIDQAHEQANAVIKGEGGAFGVTEDPSALRRWMVAGPEVSRLATEYEIVSEARDAN